jgi:type IV pilus assembly protein PilW
MVRRPQQGFGLVEIMISITLGLILAAAMIEMVLAAKLNYDVSDTMSRAQNNGRFALDLISRDIRRAGYWGINIDSGSISGTEGSATVGNSCATGDNSWGRMVGRGLYGLDDSNSGYDCIPDADYLRGDIIVTRYAAPDIVGVEGVAEAGKSYADGALYLRAAMLDGRIFSGQNKDNLANTVSETPSTDRPLRAYAYYVGATGRRCRGEPIPALYREALNDSGRPAAEELIAGVESIQFQYGAGGQYFDADEVPDWTSLDSVRLWVLMRSECPETGYRDTASYSLGDITYTPAALGNANHRRRLYSAVMSVRNGL